MCALLHVQCPSAVPLKKISILIVDDHPLFRSGVMRRLSSSNDLVLVGEAENGLEAVRRHRELRPAVTLIDLDLPELSGLEAIEKIRDECPTAQFVVISASDGEEHIRRAFEVGAGAYVLKSKEVLDLVEIVKTVAAGRRHVDTEIAALLSSEEGRLRLTASEKRILQLIGSGLSNRAVGEAMALTEVTVKNNVKNILLRLDVSDRTHAVTEALRRGILDQEAS